MYNNNNIVLRSLDILSYKDLIVRNAAENNNSSIFTGDTC